jgi:hypothetical protein
VTRCGGIRARAAVVGLLLAMGEARGGTPGATLERARRQLRETARELTKYACTETVERRYFEPGRVAEGRGEAPASTDRIRLEVTVANGREIFSWPGATRFDSRDIESIIRQGPIGTGSFAAHLLAIVDAPDSQFTFEGQGTEGGEPVWDYRFAVPLSASRYRIRAGGAWETVAYEGAARFDAGGAIRRLTVHTKALPAGSAIGTVDAEVGYPRRAGGPLLPWRSELRIGFLSGRKTVNVTTFSECREYQAESTVRFDGVTEVWKAQSRRRAADVALPIGVPVTIELTGAIDTATAAAGDAVEGRVVRAVRDGRGGGVLIPEGAVVRGRLTRVEHHVGAGFVVAMSFSRVEWDGFVAAFAAQSRPSAKVARQVGMMEEEGGGLRYWNSGVFVFATRKAREVVPAGFRSRWTTLAARGR